MNGASPAKAGPVTSHRQDTNPGGATPSRTETETAGWVRIRSDLSQWRIDEIRRLRREIEHLRRYRSTLELMLGLAVPEMAVLAELELIANGINGLDRLRERGYFVVPGSAREAQRHLEDLASPVGAFVRDLCDVGAGFEIEKDRLWEAWKQWSSDEGRDRPGTKAVFARDLHATVPGIVAIRPRDGDQRVHAYRGIQLRQQPAAPLTTPDRTTHIGDGQGPGDDESWLNHASGQGWSAVEAIVAPTDADEHEIERIANRAREFGA